MRISSGSLLTGMADYQEGYPEAYHGLDLDSGLVPDADLDGEQQEKTQGRHRGTMSGDNNVRVARTPYKYNTIQRWGTFPPCVQANHS